MNIILFNEEELGARISIHDPRIWHVKKILNCNKNDKFDIGIINGPKGEAWISDINDESVELAYN